MSPIQVLSVLKARWKIALAVMLLTILTTIGISLVLPKSYTASASVVVDVRVDPVAGLMFQGASAASYLATQMDIMVSDRVARRVVTNLKLAERPELRDAWMEATQGQTPIEAWLAGGLAQKLAVTPSKESTMISISYTAGDPEYAAIVANAFVQAYIDTTLDLRVDPAKRYSSFFDERSKQLRDNLEQANARLSKYQQEKGIIGTEDRMDIETVRLAELSSQLVAVQALSAESTSRTAQARVSSEQMQEVMSSPIVGQLRNELSQQEARMAEVGSRLGDNHPMVRELNANIAQLRTRLRTEIGRVSSSVAVTNNINRGREAELRAAVEAQRAKLLKIKGERDQLAVLQRDVESAQQSYQAVLQRLNQSSLESENNNSNVSVLSPAVAPTQASSPKIAINTILSVVIGGMLAIGAALLLEFLDRRVRSAGDIVAALDLPVLGSMPRPGASRRLGAGAVGRPRIASQVLAKLPQPAHRGH